MEKKEINPWSIVNRFLGLIGALASITIITVLAFWLKWFRDPILTAMGLFISLPIIFTFVFSLFLNTPEVRLRARKYGSIIYILVALVLFFVFFHRPESFIHFWKLFAQFWVGFIITFIAGLIYLTMFILLRNYKYRIRGGIAFAVSVSITLLIIILIRNFGLLNFLN